MTKQEATLKVKALAYQIAAELGENEAISLLQLAAREILNAQWEGPGNR